MRYINTLLLYFSMQTFLFASPINNFVAQYDLYHNQTYVGKTERRLVSKNKLLTFSSIAKTDGFLSWFADITVTEKSQLQAQDNSLNFISYSYLEVDGSKKKQYQLHIDKSKSIYNSHTQKTYPLNHDLHDTLGFTVAIMHDMKKGKREIKYSIAEKDSLKTYTLKFIEKVNIETQTGNIETFKMEHYNPHTNERFTLWCAKNMDFLPIRILSINRKGDENLLNLSQFNNKKVYLELTEEESD